MEVQAPLIMTAGELREARKAAGISQEELAAVLGVHYRTYQRWEAGEVPIRPAMERLLRHTLTFPTSQLTAAELMAAYEAVMGGIQTNTDITVHTESPPQ